MKRVIQSMEESEGTLTVTLVGAINESSPLDPKEIGIGRRVILDLKGVERINSFGVRKWVVFIKEICDVSISVTIRNLCVAMVGESAIVARFFASATIESVFVPWLCSPCEYEQAFLQDAQQAIPDAQTCPECGGSMEIDDVRQIYDNLVRPQDTNE